MAKEEKKKAPAVSAEPAKAQVVKTVPPDEIKLNGIQAQRFATLANVPMKEVAGLTIAALNEKYKWIIDPNLFLFQWVCGCPTAAKVGQFETGS